jgi:hypothetical protein
MSDVTTAATNTSNVLITNSAFTSIDYSNNQDLTSYAGSVYTNGTATIIKKGIKDLVSVSIPDDSLVLKKTIVQDVGTTIHAGGSFWTINDADYQAVRQWIFEGAIEN